MNLCTENQNYKHMRECVRQERQNLSCEREEFIRGLAEEISENIKNSPCLAGKFVMLIYPLGKQKAE